jgi:hypothetical protein
MEDSNVSAYIFSFDLARCQDIGHWILEDLCPIGMSDLASGNLLGRDTERPDLSTEVLGAIHAKRVGNADSVSFGNLRKDEAAFVEQRL